MKRIFLAVLIFLASGSGFAPPAQAEENAVKEIFTDGFYGGLAGALVGTAFMALTKHPGDHLEDIAIGSGIGILAGTAYGVVRSGRALVEIDGGGMRVQVPAIEVRLERFSNVPAARPVTPFWSAGLLSLHF